MHPKLHIQLIDAEGAHLMEMVQSGKVDVALSASLQESPGLIKLPLACTTANNMAMPVIVLDLGGINGTNQPNPAKDWRAEITRIICAVYNKALPISY